MRLRLFITGLAVLVGLARAADAQDTYGDAFWQFYTLGGFDFSSGDYGAATPTDVYYAYATLRARKGPWTVRATVPWLRVVGPAVLLDGTTGGGAVGTGVSRDESGVGDIVLSGTYSLQKFWPQGLFVDFTAKLKVPTASFAKGLGTGKTDGSFQLDVSKAFGKVMPLITAGYRITGSPAGFDLRNVIYGTVGAQYNWSTRFQTGAVFDYRQAALRTAADPREATAYLNYRFADAWWVYVYGVAGFSRNSPDTGGGIVLTFRWP